MTQRLSPSTALLLTIPPVLWAANAVLGRLLTGLVPPMTLNFMRWGLAFLLTLAVFQAEVSALLRGHRSGRSPSS